MLGLWGGFGVMYNIIQPMNKKRLIVMVFGYVSGFLASETKYLRQGSIPIVNLYVDKKK